MSPKDVQTEKAQGRLKKFFVSNAVYIKIMKMGEIPLAWQ